MAVGASIGARIKHLRERKGISCIDLAKVFHMDRGTLDRIEKGTTKKVSSQLVIDAAQYFGVRSLYSKSESEQKSRCAATTFSSKSVTYRKT